MIRIDDIRARVESAEPGEKVAAMAPHPGTGETKAEYMASSLGDDEGAPLWVVVEAAAWDENDEPFYDLYAVTGDGLYAQEHAELFAHARDDLLYLLDLVERAEGILRAHADGPYRAMTCPLCGEWIDRVIGLGHWCHLDRQAQWLRDVRGVEG